MRFIGGFICALALLAVAGIVFAYSGGFDVAASSPHYAFVRWLFNASMKHSVIARATVDEPPPFTDKMTRVGFQHYAEMCTTCHGAPGMERSEIGKGLNPQAPALSNEVKAWTPQQLFWIIKHGVRMTGMPSFGATHDDDEVWSIVAFIEKLAGMSPEQYRRMKQELSADDHEQMSHH